MTPDMMAHPVWSFGLQDGFFLKAAMLFASANFVVVNYVWIVMKSLMTFFDRLSFYFHMEIGTCFLRLSASR